MMRTRYKLAIAAAAAALSLSPACGNDNGGDVPDGGMNVDSGPPCTPFESTTFTTIYTEIFAAVTCARSACHDTATVAAGGSGKLDLSLPKDMVHTALLVDMTDASDVRGMLPHRVVAGDLTNSFLWRKIVDLDPPGFGSRMPQGCSERFPQSCLTNCEVDAINAWITAGAPND